MKKKRNSMLITAGVISYVIGAVALLFALLLGGNIAGLADYFIEVLSSMYSSPVNLESQVLVTCLELILTGSLSLYFGRFYFRVNSAPVKPIQLGKTVVFMAVLQLIFSSFLPAIFGIIAGYSIQRVKPATAVDMPKDQAQGMSEYKLTAMREAVTRLNELRSSGAIGEEEYYATLNKILEG